MFWQLLSLIFLLNKIKIFIFYIVKINKKMINNIVLNYNKIHYLQVFLLIMIIMFSHEINILYNKNMLFVLSLLTFYLIYICYDFSIITLFSILILYTINNL